MKKIIAIVSILMILSNIGCSIQDDIKKELVGVWEASEVRAAGWADTYQFFEDGKFIFSFNQMLCDKREVYHKGTWQVENNKLVFSVQEKKVLIGGSLIKASGSCSSEYELINVEEKVVQISPPENQECKLEYLEMDEDANPTRYCKIRIGDIIYWKVSDDPNNYY